LDTITDADASNTGPNDFHSTAPGFFGQQVRQLFHPSDVSDREGGDAVLMVVNTHNERLGQVSREV